MPGWAVIDYPAAACIYYIYYHMAYSCCICYSYCSCACMARLFPLVPLFPVFKLVDFRTLPYAVFDAVETYGWGMPPEES